MTKKRVVIIFCFLLVVLSIGAVFSNTEIAKEGIVTIVTGKDFGGKAATGFVIGSRDGASYVITSSSVLDGGEWIYVFASAEEVYNAAELKSFDEYGVCVLKVLGQPVGIKPLVLNTDGFPEPLDTMTIVGIDALIYLDEDELAMTPEQPSSEELLITDVKLYDGVRYFEYDTGFDERALGSPVLHENGRAVGINVYSDAVGKYAAVDIAHILPYLDETDVPYMSGMTYATKALIILITGCLGLVVIVLVIVLIATKKRYYLTGLSGIFSGSKVKLSKERIALGRNPSGCSMVYPADLKGISRRHCEIFYDKSKKRHMLIDLSSEGTFIDGKRMEKGKPYVLGYGVKFSLADQSQMFEITKKK